MGRTIARPATRRVPTPGASAGWPVVLGMVLAVLAVASLCVGTPTVAVWRLPSVIASGDGLAGVVVDQLRVPRLILAVLAGSGLGMAGLLLQTSTGNPLAVPELLGVSSGAALAVATTVVAGIAVPAGAQPLVALLGGAVGGVICVVAASRAGSAAGVLLVGAAVTAVLQALLLSVMAMASQLQYDVLFRYMVGSLSGTGWEQLRQGWPWLVAAPVSAALLSPWVSLLRLGDEAATGLGVRVQLVRIAAIAVCVLAVAAVVAPCGPVAWVSFVAPHVARRLAPQARPAAWLWLSALLGAVVAVGADLAARLVFAPIETPLGAWTAAAGIVLAALSWWPGRGRSSAAATASGAG